MLRRAPCSFTGVLEVLLVFASGFGSHQTLFSLSLFFHILPILHLMPEGRSCRACGARPELTMAKLPEEESSSDGCHNDALQNILIKTAKGFDRDVSPWLLQLENALRHLARDSSDVTRWRSLVQRSLKPRS